ncbi:MAG: M23 family metallopeptidase [Sphingomonadaceae bacterium]|nr:M23 family metallopeptidase [Sphingomonadaceae bacterium]
MFEGRIRDGMATGAVVLSAEAVPGMRQSIEERFHDIDWTPDLGQDIGTTHWWRGMASFLFLCCAAFFMWSGISPVEAREAPMRPRDYQFARAQVIAPMAWGGDSGRRMAANDLVQPLAVAPERPRIELTATLGQGDSFTRLLERSGVGGGEAARIATMVSSAIALDDITPGTRFDIVLGRRAQTSQPRPLESLAFRARLDLRLEMARQGNALAMDRIAIAVDDTPLRIRGKVGGSLYRTARAAGVPPSIVQSYLRVIAGQISVSRDIRADDEFDIIVAHRRAETGESEFGELLYAGLMQGGRARLRMLPWTVEGNRQWFEASGVGQQRAGLAAPVSGRMTSPFGMRRHPILGYVRMHAGIDFGAPFGSPVYAVSDGRVDYAGYRGGYGRYVRVQHGGGLGTGYGHMSRIAVTNGQNVRRGQVIGYVGTSGLSTGPHLHYELYRNGTPVNPLSARFQTRAILSGGDLAAFRARLNMLTALRPGGVAPPATPATSSTPARTATARTATAR